MICHDLVGSLHNDHIFQQLPRKLMMLWSLQKLWKNLLTVPLAPAKFLWLQGTSDCISLSGQGDRGCWYNSKRFSMSACKFKNYLLQRLGMEHLYCTRIILHIIVAGLSAWTMQYMNVVYSLFILNNKIAYLLIYRYYHIISPSNCFPSLLTSFTLFSFSVFFPPVLFA
jgi:hypothetical protein